LVVLRYRDKKVVGVFVRFSCAASLVYLRSTPKGAVTFGRLLHEVDSRDDLQDIEIYSLNSQDLKTEVTSRLLICWRHGSFQHLRTRHVLGIGLLIELALAGKFRVSPGLWRLLA
jgi:hypothetical protein